jgi:hypothetical protein
METIIKIKPAELTQSLIDRIRQFIGTTEGYEIELHLKPVDAAFYQKLDASLREASEGKIIRFTPDELDAYTESKLG